MSVFQNIIHTISDHGNVIASKVIMYFGIASVGTGGTLGVMNDTVQKVTGAESAAWGLADWAAVVSIAGGLSLIIKTIVDVYFKIRAERRSKQ